MLYTLGLKLSFNLASKTVCKSTCRVLYAWLRLRAVCNTQTLSNQFSTQASALYGVQRSTANMLDDGCRMGAETIRTYFSSFFYCIIHLYRDRYLKRLQTKSEIQDILDRYGENGFKGCTESVDCWKFHWKNCPVSLKGQYHNTKDGKLATIAVERWADRDLFLWHYIAGRSSTINDKTIFEVSSIFNYILNGTYDTNLFNDYRYNLNAQKKGIGYFLAELICLFVLHLRVRFILQHGWTKCSTQSYRTHYEKTSKGLLVFYMLGFRYCEENHSYGIRKTWSW